MEQIQQTAEAVIQHHLSAFIENNLEELLEDYTEESVLFTPSGSYKGRGEISEFYTWAFSALPKHQTKLDLLQQFSSEDKVYILWKAETPSISIPIGGDTFQVESGKIVFQSVVVHIIHKS